MEFRPQDTFTDRYVLKELLGRGSFGEVWLAYDKLAGIDVALKVYIALDNRGLSDFRNEYRSVYNANHPNILTPTHYDVWNNQPYLVMHYCPVSSESLIGCLSEDDIWQFISDVSSGLAYLHDQDIIHRDIKPDNILRDSQGRYVLTDFGLSKKLRASLRRNSTRAQQEDVSGALSYMGPELFESKPEAVKATDIWALGVTIYEMLVGELPFMGQGGVMQKNGADIPELPGNYSYGLRKLVHDCLQKNPWDRPSAAQLVSYKGLKELNPKDPWVKRVWRSKAFRITLISSFVVCCLWLVYVAIEERRRQHGLEILETVLNRVDSIVLKNRIDSIESRTEDPSLVQPLVLVTNGSINGHEWVDLGLSVKWATCNVGATSPSECGGYYSWGETHTKSTLFWWSTLKYCSYDSYGDDFSLTKYNISFTKYNTRDDYGPIDNKIRLDYSDDAARVNWGESWRMPTETEWEELLTNCTWVWTNQNGKKGYRVSSKTNENSIFLPAAGIRYEESDNTLGVGGVGWYWSSSLLTDFPQSAWLLYFELGEENRLNLSHTGRYCGISVRPVTE